MDRDTAGTLTPSKLDTSPSHSRSSSRAPNVRRQESGDSEKAGRVYAREVEKDPWAPCILTLDGGGIRGYSSLLILKALMHEVYLWEVRLQEEEGSERSPDKEGTIDEQHEVVAGADQATSNTIDHYNQDELTTRRTVKKAIQEEELLPCHYFDFMYGTSTGGLIATILGRLRMSVTEGLELYRKVGDDLFGSRKSRVPLATKYKHEPLEKAVQKIVSERCHEHDNCDGNDLHPWDADNLDAILQQKVPFRVDEPRVCQSCCLTATHDESISEAYLLRSYPHYYGDDAPNWINRYNEGADPIKIWEMCRATTAAPFFFEMLETVIDGREMKFKDGGIRENNPSGVALSEFHALYEGSEIKAPAVMLSVGTGRPDSSQDGFASALPAPFNRIPLVGKVLEKGAVLKNMLIKYTEGERQHESMRLYAHGEHTWYKRLNVSEGLQRMGLDEWQRGDHLGEKNVAGGASLSKMEQVTDRYLDREYDPKIDSYAPPYTMVRQAAEKLVRQRRAREKLGGPRWQTFVGMRSARAQAQLNGTAT